LSLVNFAFLVRYLVIAFCLLEQNMHFPPESQQKRLSKAQFLHLAKEAEVEANKRRWSAISERYLHPVK
tara:strand:- start:210 stop:416 length:207 start_codon:yes stop_codon:yes gene_type:complete